MLEPGRPQRGAASIMTSMHGTPRVGGWGSALGSRRAQMWCGAGAGDVTKHDVKTARL